MKLAKGDKVAIVCCSNGQSLSKKKEIENLKVILEEMGRIFKIYLSKDFFRRGRK